MKQNSLHLSDFDYVLPEELIAQTPARPRDHSRLMVLDRTNETIAHHHFYDLPSLLRPTDVLVLNNSKTLPMRTFGTKPNGGKIEVLFLKQLSLHTDHEIWEVLTRPGLKPDQTVKFADTGMTATCEKNLGYTRTVRLVGYEGSVKETLYHIGTLPTPHYIRTALQDQNDYQTIYAKPEGSSATPTAGLHFTPSIFEQLHTKGIQTIELTLHVGLGTFLPVKTDRIQDHVMHKEWFTLTPEVANQLNTWKREGRRIVSVGTTSTRVLESCAVWSEDEQRFLLHAQTGETQTFIHPPYQFKFVDAMTTNFHLPKSTLLMLVSALCSQGKIFTTFKESFLGRAYAEAIAQKYRFFSFGDAMLIE